MLHCQRCWAVLNCDEKWKSPWKFLHIFCHVTFHHFLQHNWKWTVNIYCLAYMFKVRETFTFLCVHFILVFFCCLHASEAEYWCYSYQCYTVWGHDFCCSYTFTKREAIFLLTISKRNYEKCLPKTELRLSLIFPLSGRSHASHTEKGEGGKVILELVIRTLHKPFRWLSGWHSPLMNVRFKYSFYLFSQPPCEVS